MPDTIMLPNGEPLTLPDLPKHHHEHACACVSALVYVRVSDIAGRDHLVSPHIQVDSAASWARANGRRIVRLIFDIDKSGQTFIDRSVATAIEGCRNGDWFTIILWKWSRWGRDLAESLVWLKRVESAGGEVRSATEDVDPAYGQSTFMRNFHLLMADEHGRQIGQGWQQAHKNRREARLPHSGRPRFGYDYADKRYAPNGEAPTLADCYRRYIAGESLRSLVRFLNAKGFRTTRGKAWTPQALGKMLDTGFGAGLIRERSQPGAKPANRLASYDVWRPGAHEPVISAEEWRAYKARREWQAELPPRSRVAVHAVSGLLFCGLCGRRLTTKYQGRNRTHQWTCLSRTPFHPDVHVGISNAMILDLLHAWVEDRVPGRAGRLAEEEAERLARAQCAASDVQRLERELAHIEARKENLLELRVDGEISKGKYMERLAVEEEKARALRAELTAASAQSAEAGGDLELAFGELSANWGVASQFPADHREAIASVVAGVLIFPGKGKLELASRVSVVPAWKASELWVRVAELRAAE